MIDAPPERAFAALPEVVGATAGVHEGAEWVAPYGRAHLVELDLAERRFVYRSKQAGDNPSFTLWTWRVDPADGGRRSRVTLAWDLRPVTFVRKRVTSHLQNRRIARTEAPAALAALAKAASA